MKTAEEAVVLRRESRQSSRLVAKVRSKRPSMAEFLASIDDEVCGRPLVEAFVALSREYRFCEPGTMLEAAFAAHVAAGNLDSRRYTSAMIADLRARTFAELGNAYRVNEDYEAAEQAFLRAHAYVGQGAGDPFVLARVLDLEASLWSAQRHLAKAIDQLDALHNLYECLGEGRLTGRALISKARNILYAGNPQEAASVFREGLSRLDISLDWQLTPHGQLGVLHALIDSGDFHRARHLMLESGLGKAFGAEPLNLLRLRWIEGKLHTGLGRLARAETIFLQVRAVFLRQRLNYDAAIVGLDLADVWLRQGRMAEVRQIASDAFQTFKHLKVEWEAAHFLTT